MARSFLVAFNRTRRCPVATKVRRAATARARAKGLLGRSEMPPEEGLWITPCPMIHTFFMRFPIDVLFLDKQGRVVRVVEKMPPWRISPWVISAHSVLELCGGALEGSVDVGDKIEIRH